MRKQVDPADVAGLRPLAELDRELGEAGRTLVKTDEIGGDLADGVERARRRLARSAHPRQRRA